MSLESRIGEDFERFLDSQERKSLLRVVVCGGVDDGKSTVVRTLLHESRQLFAEELQALEVASRDFGARTGPNAEREAITVDVAYRFFTTDKRHFVVADAPGHELYTRNMVTGASTADVAVILVDARKGLLAQTRRHAYLVALLGTRGVALAVNKLDLLGYSREQFERIEADFRSFAETIRLQDIVCIPMSALRGDNVTEPSINMAWYKGPTLMDYLEGVEVDTSVEERPFRMPVQWVNRPSPDFHGYSGRIVGGAVEVGTRVCVPRSGRASTVARIVVEDGDLDRAVAGQSITLTLAEEIDIGRGDMLVAADAAPGIADQFEATIIWMADEEMLPGRPYLMKIGAKTVGVSLVAPKYRLNVNTLEHVAARTLQLNEIGVCNLNLDQSIPFDSYAENRDTGGFILIDRFTNGTVGAGLIHFALRRSQNIHWQAVEIDKQAHAALKNQKPCIIWFTGLSGAGKSTIANLVEKKLHGLGRHTFLLDGDNVRHGLSKDLGFKQADRVENIRRVAEVAKLMVDAGLIVLVSFISPFRAERRFARGLVDRGEFCEVFVDVPLGVAERRDKKGLYAKARRGELLNFTGIDSPYENPEDPEVRIDAATTSPEEAAEGVVSYLREFGVLDPSCADIDPTAQRRGSEPGHCA